MSRRSEILLSGCLAAILPLAGCYALRSSSGGGQARFEGPRQVNAADVLVPPGFAVEVVAQDLTFPTGVAFDEAGRVHVLEAGYAYGEVWREARLLRLDPDGTRVQVAGGGEDGPWNGVAFHDGRFYIAQGSVLRGGSLLRVSGDGGVEVLVEGLPSLGDHHTNGPVVDPDGWVYFGQGTATNSGVVGADSDRFGWLRRHPGFHDIPGEDIVLAGRNFESRDLLNEASAETVLTGAFVPFGHRTEEGQVVRGQVPCTGAIMRVPAAGGAVELVAWGLRNPFGLAFAPDGRLFATDNGYDDRGSRPVWGAPDYLWHIEPGTWYGWPDYSGHRPLSSESFRPPGKDRPEFLLARHPNEPPRPVVSFGVHSSSNGLDFSRSERFGFLGQAFVAQFGDLAPEVGKVMGPVGFKVVRVDVGSGLRHEFAANRGARSGPASLTGSRGMERPTAARFDSSGESLYVVDFGVVTVGRNGPEPVPGTGVLWRIYRGRQP